MDANYVFLVGNINSNNNNNININNSNNSESLTGKQSVVTGAAGAAPQQQQQSPTDAEILMIPTSNLQKFIENADKILKNMTSNSSSNMVVASGSLPSEQRTGWYTLPSMGVAHGIEIYNLTASIRSLCLFTNLPASQSKVSFSLTVDGKLV